ncbi:MAG: hypothetical protein H6739_17535 [Alphaproteobacteria bacterium]|nr:hypothetical protein [Alphaproteobacteria bacterium]
MSPRTLLLALLVTELLATLADLLLGPWLGLAPEEAHNARAGLLVACGHYDDLWAMQYRDFCGGCSAEAVMAAPLVRGLGPSVLAWKLVPALLHLAVVGGAAAWAARRLGARGAALVVLLLAGAPGFYRALALTGFGNHAESSAFPLVAAALLLVEGPRLLRFGAGLLAGGVAGLGLWFCYTSAHGLPALLLVVALGGRWRAPGFVLGLPVGALPWWAYHHTRPAALQEAGGWWTTLHPAPPGELVDWLFGDFVRLGLWPPVEHGALGPFPDLWWGLAWVLAALGAALSLRRAPFPATALLTLLAAFALRYDLWDDSTRDPAAAAFLLRYRAPLIPLLAMNIAAAWALARRGRSWILAAALALALSGVALRVSQWTHPPGRALAPLALLDGEADRTVPAGLPPERLPRDQGRPQDIDAALAFLRAHQDPLPACRALHVQELGRRMGLSGAEDRLEEAQALGAPEALARGLEAGAAQRR